MKEFIIDKNIRLDTTAEYKRFSAQFPTTLKKGFIAYTDQMLESYFEYFIRDNFWLFDIDKAYNFFIKRLQSIKAIGNPSRYCEMYELKLMLMMKKDNFEQSDYYKEQKEKYFDKMVAYLELLDNEERDRLITHLIKKNIKMTNPIHLSKGICRYYDCITVKNTKGEIDYFRNGKHYLILSHMKESIFWDRATHGKKST